MARLKGVVCEIKKGEACVLLEDGVRLVFPLDKLPNSVAVGTFLSISIRVDHIAALLNTTNPIQLFPKGEGIS